MIYQKYFTKLQKMKKIGKRLGTTYCFGCKDFTHNFRPEKVKLANKFNDQISQDF